MVGDSPSNDVRFGKAAGVSTALLDTGRRYTEGGGDGGADILVDVLSRLPHQIWQHFEVQSAAAAHLEKHAVPAPTGAASVAAARGDVEELSRMSREVLNAPDPDNGNTPLIWAANGGHAEAVRVLVESGVEVNHRGFLGATATARASRAGHAAVLEALLAACGLDPNIVNDKQQSPLHFAAFKRKPQAVELLLGHSACNPFVLDRKGRTPAEDTSDAAIRARIEAAQQALLGTVPKGELNA